MVTLPVGRGGDPEARRSCEQPVANETSATQAAQGQTDRRHRRTGLSLELPGFSIKKKTLNVFTCENCVPGRLFRTLGHSFVVAGQVYLDARRAAKKSSFDKFDNPVDTDSAFR